MKVLALGGAGDMGRMAVAVLLDSPKVSSVTVADINIKLAETFVEFVGSDRLKAVQIDINEKEKLIKLMKEHDIVINTIGPYYKYEIPILEAIFEVKKNFLDICDDWKPTLDALELDQKAKNANITAIIGIGASPGITNLLAVYACSMLDEIDELITAWGVWALPKEGKKPKYYINPKKLKKKLGPTPKKANAAIEHLLFETLEKIPTYKDGKIIYINSLTETERLEFPGFKDMYACHIGHPEPVTLPRTLKAKTISNRMYIGETATEITRQIRQKIINKELTIKEASLALEDEFLRLFKQAKMLRAPFKEFYGGPPDLCAIAYGMKNGLKKNVAVALARNPYDEMAGLTGVPLAIATIMMIEGKITAKGVFTPEESIAPMEFFENLAPYCGNNLNGKEILIIRDLKQ